MQMNFFLNISLVPPCADYCFGHSIAPVQIGVKRVSKNVNLSHVSVRNWKTSSIFFIYTPCEG